MAFSKKHFTDLAQRSGAGLMAFWLSGFLFLFCCAAMPSVKAADEFCPLSKKSEHCDKGVEKDGFFEISTGTGHDGLGCCGYLPAVFDKSRKLERTEGIAEVPAVISIAAPVPHQSEFSFRVAATYSPPIIYHEKVFITNCVFRI
ncbi:MAG: hypothetical protein WKF92_03080 [Pyrinomonadaceae bacterium]